MHLSIGSFRTVYSLMLTDNNWHPTLMTKAGYFVGVIVDCRDPPLVITTLPVSLTGIVLSSCLLPPTLLLTLWQILLILQSSVLFSEKQSPYNELLSFCSLTRAQPSLPWQLGKFLAPPLEDSFFGCSSQRPAFKLLAGEGKQASVCMFIRASTSIKPTSFCSKVV